MGMMIAVRRNVEQDGGLAVSGWLAGCSVGWDRAPLPGGRGGVWTKDEGRWTRDELAGDVLGSSGKFCSCIRPAPPWCSAPLVCFWWAVFLHHSAIVW